MRVIKTKDRSKLIQAAMGKIPCDLTIGNVQFLNVITGEIYPASVDILDGFVVLVREEGQEPVLPAKKYYDGCGKSLPRHPPMGHHHDLHRPPRDRQRYGR